VATQAWLVKTASPSGSTSIGSTINTERPDGSSRRIPELVGTGAFDQLGRAPPEIVVCERSMPECVAQALAEFVTDGGNLPISGSAIRASITPVFDKRNLCSGRAEHLILVLIDRAIEPMHHHPSNLTSERCIEAISYDHYGNTTAPSTPPARDSPHDDRRRLIRKISLRSAQSPLLRRIAVTRGAPQKGGQRFS